MDANERGYGAALLPLVDICHSALLIALGFVNHAAHLRVFAFIRGLNRRRTLTRIRYGTSLGRKCLPLSSAYRTRLRQTYNPFAYIRVHPRFEVSRSQVLCVNYAFSLPANVYDILM